VGRFIIGNKIEGIPLQDLSDYLNFTLMSAATISALNVPFADYRTNPLRWIKAYEEVDLEKSDFFEQKSRQYTNIDNGFDEL
jgi:ribonucleoside-diphosphate reductase beta chain